MKKTLLMILILLIGLTGCEYVPDDFDSASLVEGARSKMNDVASMERGHYTPKELGPTINEYFGEEIKFAYRRIDESVVNCRSGECPEGDSSEYFLDSDCFFCNQSSEVYEDRIIAHTSPMMWSDFMGRCSDKNQFGYPEEFEIIEKTPTRITAKGVGSGSHMRVGEGCHEEFNYTFDSHETWVFTTEPFDASIMVESTTGQTEFSAPAINYGKNYVEKYSDTKLKITCESMDGFQIRPWVVLTEVNGVNATKQQNVIKINREGDDYFQNPAYFNFASRYNGNYKVKGICQLYGKNGNVLFVKEGDVEYTAKVGGADVGDIDMDIFN